jgi:hypothetical protein
VDDREPRTVLRRVAEGVQLEDRAAEVEDADHQQ